MWRSTRPTAARSCASAARSSCPCSSTATASSPTRRAILELPRGAVPRAAALSGRAGARRAELRVFLDWFNLLWKRPPNLIVAEEEKPAPDRARIADLEQRIADSLPVFEDLLAGRDFLFGDELSVADVTAFPFLKYAVLWTEGDPDRFHEILRDTMRLDGRYPRLEAWIHRVDALPRA